MLDPSQAQVQESGPAWMLGPSLADHRRIAELVADRLRIPGRAGPAEVDVNSALRHRFEGLMDRADLMLGQLDRAGGVGERPVDLVRSRVNHRANELGRGRGDAACEGVERADSHNRLREAVRKRLGDRHPDPQAGERPRPECDDYRVELRGLEPGIGEHLLDIRQYPAQQVHLVMEPPLAYQLPVPPQGERADIAGRINGKRQHSLSAPRLPTAASANRSQERSRGRSRPSSEV